MRTCGRLLKVVTRQWGSGLGWPERRINVRDPRLCQQILGVAPPSITDRSLAVARAPGLDFFEVATSGVSNGVPVADLPRMLAAALK